MVRNKQLNPLIVECITQLAIALPARREKREAALFKAWEAMDKIYYAMRGFGDA